jgi:hypothetical protein
MPEYPKKKNYSELKELIEDEKKRRKEIIENIIK